MIKRLLLSVFLMSIPQWALSAQNHPAFQIQGQLFDEAGVHPLNEVVDVRIGIYSADGNCLLYQEEKSGVDLTQEGVFSLTVGSSLGAPARTAGVDPGNTMVAVFANKGAAIQAKVTAACPSGSYTPAVADGRKLRLSVVWSGGTTVFSDQLISSVPQALVAETLQGLEPKNFLQVANAASAYSLNKSDLDVAFSAGASDASTLHHHDSLYAKLSTGGSIAMANSSYLGLGVHASSPDTSSWGGDASKIGRTWYDSGSKEIKYWNGTSVQTLGKAIPDGTAVNIGFPLLATNGGPPEYAALGLDGSAVTGTLPVSRGGTGSTTASEAFNALAPSQAGNSGKFLTTNGSGTVSWASPSGLDLTAATDFGTTAASAVTIGKSGQTTNINGVVTQLELAGTLKFGTGVTGCGVVTAGSVVYDIASQSLQVCDGSNWTALGTAASMVSIAGNQTISGTKTFSASTTFAGIDNGTQGITGSGHITGFTGAGSNLAINATSNATLKGNILLNNAGGKVGIGLSSPAAKLEVNGDIAFNNTGGARVALSASGSASTSYVFPSAVGSNGQVLSTDASGNLSWITPSVGFPNQSPNAVFAGPSASGAGSAAPSFRALVEADLPTISAADKIANSATTATSANTANAIVARAADGSFSAGAITGTDLSANGNIAATGNISAAGSMTATGSVTATGNISSSGGAVSSVGGFSGTQMAAGADFTGLTLVNSSGNAGSDVSIMLAGNAGGNGNRSLLVKYRPNPNGFDSGWYSGYDGENAEYVMGQLNGAGVVQGPSFVITSSGDMGLGTASPAAKLDVNGAIVLRGATSGTIKISAPAVAGNQNYELPANTGSSGQVLATNGTGTLSWKSIGTACPSGTTAVRGGGPDAFCVSGLQPSSGWISAVKTCNTLKMHLCSAEEWVSACAELDASWTTEMQWTAELYSNNATALQKAGAGCSNMSVAASGVAGPYQYRCCSRPE